MLATKCIVSCENMITNARLKNKFYGLRYQEILLMHMIIMYTRDDKIFRDFYRNGHINREFTRFNARI